jgi:hypothetical protein
MRSFIRRTWIGILAVTGISSGAARCQELIYGMTTASSTSTAAGINLVSFNSTTPGTITTVGAFSGVVAGQNLHGIALQPSTNTMYAISSDTTGGAFQLYTVNRTTAALTAVGSGFNLGGNTSTALTMSFNPVTNEIRVATRDGTNNNFRVSPTTGALLGQDTSFAWAAGDTNAGSPISVIGLAHTNNGSSATLVGWEYNTDALVRIGGTGGTPSPNGGVLTTVGTSPAAALTFNAGLGMAISGATGTLYVSHDDPAAGTSMSLFTRDMTTGAETLVGAYPAGTFIHEIAVFTPVPEPALTLAGAGLIGWIVARRFRTSSPTQTSVLPI